MEDARPLGLRRLSVVDVVNVLVVVQVAGFTLDAVPGRMFALAGGRGQSQPTRSGPGEPLWRARLGRVAVGARGLAAGGLHDPTDVVVQDALGVLLVRVSGERAAVADVNQTGVVMLRTGTRGRSLTG